MGGTAVSGSKNFLLDKVLIVAGPGTTNVGIGISAVGVTVRNCYLYRPPLTLGSGKPGAEVRLTNGGTSTAGHGPVEIYNLTVLSDLAAGSIGENYLPVIVEEGSEATVENNVFLVPSREGHAEDGEFMRLGLDGFISRHKGLRWNFPPIGGTGFQAPIEVTSRREGSSGGLSPGPIAVGEWITLEYPDYSGLCDGHGFKVTRERILANSTQFHQVSITSVNSKRMSPIVAGGNGKVLFDFEEEAIRIQNTGDEVWSSGEVWVLLDLSDYLMDFKVGTSISGQQIPALYPVAGSRAVSTVRDGLWALDDFHGFVRRAYRARGAFEVRQ
jgi:hypothetical protein